MFGLVGRPSKMEAARIENLAQQHLHLNVGGGPPRRKRKISGRSAHRRTIEGPIKDVEALQSPQVRPFRPSIPSIACT